jgi:hypothetical protein
VMEHMRRRRLTAADLKTLAEELPRLTPSTRRRQQTPPGRGVTATTPFAARALWAARGGPTSFRAGSCAPAPAPFSRGWVHLVHVATVSHGAAASQREPLGYKENILQHTRHEKGARLGRRV